MKIYNAIEEELKKAPDSFKQSGIVLFQTCQKYWWLYCLNVQTENARRVFQNYMEEGICLNVRNRKKERERIQSLYPTSKLYIEFFWKAYNVHYKEKGEKDFFDEIIHNDYYWEKIDELWKEIFKNSANNTLRLKKSIQKSFKDWTDDYTNISDMEDLHLENLHKAMEEFGNGLDVPTPSICKSAENVLTSEILQTLLDYLKAKNYPAFLFTTAPILRSLTSGKISSFTPQETETPYFNLGFQNNLTDLENYINVLTDMYNDYEEVKSTLEEVTRKYL